MYTSIGPLLDADESFDHQIVDTFATVSQTDRGWAEKVCATAAAQDGSIQLDFGIGKYINRNVVDAYAGISRGKEQWTVRASRALNTAPGVTAAGPIHYQVIKPYESVQFRLDANDIQPISFEWNFTAKLPPVVENREHRRSIERYRIDEDLMRYHQMGMAHGWLELEGERMEFEQEHWFSTRDHSWGVRQHVGLPLQDVPSQPHPDGLSVQVSWSPMILTDKQGQVYGIHHYGHAVSLPGYKSESSQGSFEYPDGRRVDIVGIEPRLRFNESNRRLLGGSIVFTLKDQTRREITIEPLSDTGFHLGAGLYMGFDDHWHGEWRGELHVDGEYFADCSDPDTARRLHQHRDCVIRVTDPDGGGTGFGNIQTILLGGFPDIGLSEESSFL